MTSSSRLAGRVALVTGAGAGIGNAIACAFAAAGARVAVVDIDADAAERTVRQIGGGGGAALAVECDVADGTAVAAAVEAAAERFGALDVVCNNAATTVPTPTVETLSEEDWDRVQEVNVKSIYLAVRAAAPHLRSSDGAAILNVASVDGLTAEPGIAAYCASKGAVVNLTRALALDFAPAGIRVNCVCPGMTDTPLFRHFIGLSNAPATVKRERLRRVPLGRLVEPEEVARVALFLCSAEASAVTGAALPVDNGLGAGWDFSAP